MLNDVKQFMTIAGCLPKRGECDERLAGLYVGLIAEEMGELLHSQGLVGSQGLAGLSDYWKKGTYRFIQDEEALDAAVDLAWVALGLAYAMGADVEGACRAVAENNLSKFPMVDGKRTVLRDENGKIRKPDGFKSVELGPYL